MANWARVFNYQDKLIYPFRGIHIISTSMVSKTSVMYATHHHTTTLIWYSLLTSYYTGTLGQLPRDTCRDFCLGIWSTWPFETEFPSSTCMMYTRLSLVESFLVWLNSLVFWLPGHGLPARARKILWTECSTRTKLSSAPLKKSEFGLSCAKLRTQSWCQRMTHALVPVGSTSTDLIGLVIVGSTECRVFAILFLLPQKIQRW